MATRGVVLPRSQISYPRGSASSRVIVNNATGTISPKNKDWGQDKYFVVNDDVVDGSSIVK